MVGHGRSAGRENRKIGATLALQPQLVRLDAGADFIVADCRRLRQRQ
jgi:hypothetical protein